MNDLEDRCWALMDKVVTVSGMAATRRYDPETREPIMAPWSVTGTAVGWHIHDGVYALIEIAGYGEVPIEEIEVVAPTSLER